MSTVIRYTGNPNGYMDFYMNNERIMCENSIAVLTAQELWDAITSTEDEQLALGYLGIATADGKNPNINSALNVNLLRGWRIGTEKVNGSFELTGGNTTSETLGVKPFEANNLVFMINLLSQFGTTITVGSGVLPADVIAIADKTRDTLLRTQTSTGAGNSQQYDPDAV